MAAVMMPAEAATDTLANHLGRSRIVLVFAGTTDNAKLLTQRRIVQADTKGMVDRDLVIIPVIGTDEHARATATRYGIEPGRFQVVLVGKDGSAYLRSATPIQLPDLFSRIDAMPMRRAEMRDRGR